MASNKTDSGKKPLTKEQAQALQKRRQEKARREMLSAQRAAAVSNLNERNARGRGGYGDYDDYGDYSQPSAPTQNYAAGYNNGLSEVDHRFATDVQKMKFCRKPVGFLMSLIFLIAIALVALSFLPIEIPVPIVNQFTAAFQESEAKPVTPTPDQGSDEQGSGDSETPAEAAPSNADGDTDTDNDTTTGEETAPEATESGDKKGDNATYYTFSDPVFGWISFIAKKVGFDLSLGESPWYDAQLAKVETGMTDSIAPILIQAFPAAIILYLIFALALFIKTFICWASGDRRIYRHTSIECLLMLICAAVVLLGGFAATVEVDGAMDFGGILNYAIGTITGTGGFTAGFGVLIMVALPLVGLILSFFLLEKKLRSREITQPIILYQYKDSYRKAQGRAGR